MHTFKTALVLAASLATAQATYQERSNSLEGKDYTLIKTTATVNALEWKLNIRTVLNEDSGYQYMRWKHTLIAPIQKTDEIIFEVNFQSLGDPAGRISVPPVMGEDTARCTVAINTADERFWKGTVADGYYKCDGTAVDYAAATTGVSPTPIVYNVDICQAQNTWNSEQVQIETAEWNSWVIPPGFEDDDVDIPANRWCDATNVKGEAVQDYQCKSIKCHMERKLQTGDELQDFYFNPTSKTVCDTLTIRPGRARIFFNQQVYPKAFQTRRRGKNDRLAPITEIPICAGAATLASAVGAVLAGAYLF